MRYVGLVFAAALGLAACGQGAPAAGGGATVFPNLFQTAYRAEATVTSENGHVQPLVMIRDGNKQRLEFESPQGNMAVIINGDTGDQFVITSSGGQTVAVRGGAPGGLSDPGEAWAGDMATTATRTGACSGAGLSGSEWTNTTSGDTACITDDGIILSATHEGRPTWQTTSVQRGPQSPDLFVLPPGVQLMDLSAIMGPAIQAAQGGGEAQTALCEALRGQSVPANVLSRAGC